MIFFYQTLPAFLAFSRPLCGLELVETFTQSNEVRAPFYLRAHACPLTPFPRSLKSGKKFPGPGCWVERISCQVQIFGAAVVTRKQPLPFERMSLNTVSIFDRKHGLYKTLAVHKTRLDTPILNLGALHFWKNLSNIKVFLNSCQLMWLKFLQQ